MKYKKYPDSFWRTIETTLRERQDSGQDLYAAFDADGTLWDTDLGETFFKYQIQHQLLPNLPTDPWNHYRQWKESGDPRPAYLWLAQINAGVSLKTVQTWAEESVQQFQPLPIFSEQQKLIELLHKNKVHVYVVTASVKWAVEPGALRLGIDHAHVLGVETEVHQGLVTDVACGQMTYREGKIKALLEKTKGQAPFLCSGNTMGDFNLLLGSSHLQICVGAAGPGDELWKTEEQLRQEARQRQWLFHQFEPITD